MKKIYLCLLLLAGIDAFAQKISPTEKQIIEDIKANAARTEKLLEQVVNINSGTLNHEGVKQVGQIFRKEFEDMGFTTEWVSLPDSLNRAGHLVAYRKGKKGKKLFLIGHLDTVFEKSMPFTPVMISFGFPTIKPALS